MDDEPKTEGAKFLETLEDPEFTTTLADKDRALILAIQDLTMEIRRSNNG